MDPRSRILLVGAVGILAVVLEQAASLGLLAGLSAGTLLVVATPRWRARILLLLAAAVWSTVLSQAIFYADLPRVPALRIGPLVLWQEGLSYGLVQSLRFVAVACAGGALVASTALDRMLAALLRLRVPFPLAFLAVTGLRFVPEVGREVLVVRRARARRGRAAWRRSPWAWLRLEISLLRPIVARAVRRARTLSESLDVRGFDPATPRAVRRPLRMRPWEPLLLAAVAALTASAIAARLLYVIYVSDLAYFPALRELYGFVRSWL